MGDINSQIRLLSTLESYERAQRAADICPGVAGQQDKAEQLYLQLAGIALACGYEAGGRHAHLTTYQWAQQRAATLRRVFPNHISEARP